MYLLTKNDYYNFPIEHPQIRGVIYVETEEEVEKAIVMYLSDLADELVENSLEVDWEGGRVDFASVNSFDDPNDPDDSIFHSWKLEALVKP
jgi:hypothetical protein